MVASSSTFRIRDCIRDLCHLLHAARHSTDVLVKSEYPREAAASAVWQ